ncbi:MAG: ABC transporter substrate-binding protein [Burkholderiales bacterium]
MNDRRVNFISNDDGYSPPRTVEMARKLVEQDQVLFVFQTLGTPSNTAIHKYMNMKKVPQMHVATGATKWNDPKNHPWTMGWQPNYQTEAAVYARHILRTKPDAKIAVLYQNDDYGKDYLKGFKDGLGANAKMIVAEASYEVSEPTIDSQVVQLQSSGANVFFNITTPKFAAQAIRKAYDIGWKPVHYLNNVSTSVGSVLTPAGLEKSAGLITTAYLKDPTDKRWDSDPAVKRWREFMQKYHTEGNVNDSFNIYGYTVASTLHQVLKQAGDNLTRDNIMRQAASMKDYRVDTLLPRITISTSKDDFAPIEAVQLQRFNGKQWELFGEVLSSDK